MTLLALVRNYLMVLIPVIALNERGPESSIPPSILKSQHITYAFSLDQLGSITRGKSSTIQLTFRGAKFAGDMDTYAESTSNLWW
jgi:hypothetical protein